MTEPWYQEYQDLFLERGMIGLDLETTGIDNFTYERPTSAALLGLTENLRSPEIIITTNVDCQHIFYRVPVP